MRALVKKSRWIEKVLVAGSPSSSSSSGPHPLVLSKSCVSNQYCYSATNIPGSALWLSVLQGLPCSRVSHPSTLPEACLRTLLMVIVLLQAVLVHHHQGSDGHHDHRPGPFKQHNCAYPPLSQPSLNTPKKRRLCQPFSASWTQMRRLPAHPACTFLCNPTLNL